MEGFRRGDFQVLVATNIAARGLDVDRGHPGRLSTSPACATRTGRRSAPSWRPPSSPPAGHSWSGGATTRKACTTTTPRPWPSPRCRRGRPRRRSTGRRACPSGIGPQGPHGYGAVRWPGKRENRVAGGRRDGDRSRRWTSKALLPFRRHGDTPQARHSGGVWEKPSDLGLAC
jgi:ATP-dependent RNA helicase RhlE